MPDRGLRRLSSIEGLPVLDSSRHDWQLTGARWCQVTYEVDRDAVLGALPCDVSRPIPCYARLLVGVAEDSPHGPMGFAALSAGARSEMMPRNVIIQQFVEGPVAAAAATFGGSVEAAGIAVDRVSDAVVATISSESQTLVTVRLPALRPVDNAMLRWDTWLEFASAAEGPQLFDVVLNPSPRASFLSRRSTIETAPDLGTASVWNRFRNLNTISACFVEGDLTLNAAQPRAVPT